MGRRKGDAKRIKPGSKPSKITLYTEGEAEAARSITGDNNGELPLFNSSPKLARSRQVDRRTRPIEPTSSHKLEKPGKGDRAGKAKRRSDVSADVHLGGPVDSGWPLGNQEIASSFRFELDSGRLQAMLPTPGGSFRSTTPSGSFPSTPGGSFRFRNEDHLPHGSHLKPPRPMENPIHHGSNRFADANSLISGESANLHREDQSSKLGLQTRSAGISEGKGFEVGVASDWSIVPFEARNNVAVDVPNSPERSVILQRLKDLKSQSASPRFGLEDDVSYHKELAKLTVGRDDGLNQWLKTSSPLWKTNSSSSLKQSSSYSPSPSPAAQPTQELASSSRFKNGRTSLQEQVLSRNVNSPSPDHTHFLPAAIPFQWEDQPGKPKSTRLSRKLSREAVEIVKYMENLPSVEITGTSADGGIGNGDEARTESHRYYGKAQLRGHSREASLGQSSRRNSTTEKLIDLDASAAAKFLVEQYDSTPGRRSSSPAFAVPFKWEDAPGKAKVETPARRPNSLQLPPRLAVPSYRGAESFGMRASHPFAGFFAQCLTAASGSPGDHRKHASLEPSKSLPPRVKRHGLVGRCSSLPQEGCHINVSRSTASSPALKPTGRDFSGNPNSSPTSILHGPDGSSSQTSASNGDLDEFTQQTSKSSSYASIEEYFTEVPPPLHSGGTLKPDPHRLATSSTLLGASPRNGDPATLLGASTASRNGNPEIQPMQLPAPPLHSGGTLKPDPHRLPTTSSASSTLLKASSRNGDPAKLLGASTASRNGDPEIQPVQVPPLHSGGTLKPDPHRLATTASVSSTLLGASSRNGDPATILLGASTACDSEIQPVQVRGSPKRPSRLPYTMPSVAEQVLALSAGRQLIQDLSPRLLRQYSGRRLTRSSNTGPASQAEELYSPSPAHAAALELLSPTVNLMAKRRSPAIAKPRRRRPRFMLSICRTLKRIVFGRQRRCKPIEPTLMMYCDALAPRTFQFSKSN